MKVKSQMFGRKGVSKTLALLVEKLLPDDKVLQSYARKFRTPVLTCAQDDSKKRYPFRPKKSIVNQTTSLKISPIIEMTAKIEMTKKTLFS